MYPKRISSSLLIYPLFWYFSQGEAYLHITINTIYPPLSYEFQLKYLWKTCNSEVWGIDGPSLLVKNEIFLLFFRYLVIIRCVLLYGIKLHKEVAEKIWNTNIKIYYKILKATIEIRYKLFNVCGFLSDYFHIAYSLMSVNICMLRKYYNRQLNMSCVKISHMKRLNILIFRLV